MLPAMFPARKTIAPFLRSLPTVLRPLSAGSSAGVPKQFKDKGHAEEDMFFKKEDARLRQQLKA